MARGSFDQRNHYFAMVRAGDSHILHLLYAIVKDQLSQEL